MKETLQEINSLVAAGIIDTYAIGGAVGATFYIEPAATQDVDIFVSLESKPGSLLISLTPIYTYLLERGHKLEREYVIIFGWPVQFLPPGDALDKEALDQAVDVDLDGVRTRVMRAEHLAAIALRLGRAKDKLRLLEFVESGALDPKQFDAVLVKHGLEKYWESFGKGYLAKQ